MLRIALEPMRQRPQSLEFDQARHRRRQPGQRFQAIVQETQGPVARAVVGLRQVVELGETAAERTSHQSPTPGVRRRVLKADMQGVTRVASTGREEASCLQRQAGCEPETVVRFQPFSVIFELRVLPAAIALET